VRSPAAFDDAIASVAAKASPQRTHRLPDRGHRHETQAKLLAAENDFTEISQVVPLRLAAVAGS